MKSLISTRAVDGRQTQNARTRQPTKGLGRGYDGDNWTNPPAIILRWMNTIPQAFGGNFFETLVGTCLLACADDDAGRAEL